MSKVITEGTRFKVGDKFKPSGGYTEYIIRALYSTKASDYVTYEADNGSMGTARRSAFDGGNYFMVEPFFEEGKKYRYIGWRGRSSGAGNDHEILHVQESEGKMVALYVEIDGDDRWHGAFTENDFKNYKKVSA